jgi:hypothetical protein
VLGDLRGQTRIDRHTWNHVVCVRDGNNVAVYLNGRPQPELAGEVPLQVGERSSLVFGAAPDNRANFEGRLDEIAVYQRALAAEDVTGHYQAARARPAPRRLDKSTDGRDRARLLKLRVSPPSPPTPLPHEFAISPSTK